MLVALAGTVSATAKVSFADDNVNAIATIQQVIQHNNDEQVQAIATRNLSLMADTHTDDQFQMLANSFQDMLTREKVTALALLELDWGPITVSADGQSATATTIETWEVTSVAGTVDDAPVRNDYTLIFDNGSSTWKIKSDAQGGPLPQVTSTPIPPTATATPTATASPTATVTPTPTATPTPTPEADMTSPDMTSPDTSSPDTSSPDVTAPDETAPPQ